MTASSLNSHSETESMTIDAVHVKSVNREERNRRMEEGLCLYCSGEGHEVGSNPKKQTRRTVKARGAFVKENEKA